MEKKDVFFGLMIALFLAMILSPFASPWPDGLEKVAEDKGFLDNGKVAPVFASPIPDYVCPGIKSEKLATSVAGIAGTIVVFIMGYGLALLIRGKA
ncbi:MAG: PDGLE domain-containing protein [Candidatus Omnitrophota bacterium]